MISKYRPEPRIYAFTPSKAVCNRMNLLWGVTPIPCPASLSVQSMGEFAEFELRRLQVVGDGDVFGLIAGTSQAAGATNFLRLMIAGAKYRRAASFDFGVTGWSGLPATHSGLIGV